jgi:hypothetical protein
MSPSSCSFPRNQYNTLRSLLQSLRRVEMWSWRIKGREPESVREARRIIWAVVAAGYASPKILHSVKWGSVYVDSSSQEWQSVTFRERWWSFSPIVNIRMRGWSGQWKPAFQNNGRLSIPQLGVVVTHLQNGCYTAEAA